MYELNAHVRVRPGVDIFAGLVGIVVAYDVAHPLRPYVVVEDGDEPRRPRFFAEHEIERAPIETKVVEGIVGDDTCGRYVGLTPLDEILDDCVQGDEVRIIIEVLKRGER